MNKLFYTLLFVIFAGVSLSAQEHAISSQYQIFPILVNPALTGFNNQHEVLVNARSSWQGFPGKPSTITAMYTAPVGDRLALGGGIFSDKAGDMNITRFQLNYAFRFQLNRAKFGIGLSTEFLNQSIDNEILNHWLVDPNDAVLENQANNQRIFDASVGLHMVYDERIQLSLALPGTIRTQLDEVPTAGTNQPETENRLFNHYIFQIGYIANIASQNFTLIPSITLRDVRNTPYQIDLNLQARFMEERLIAGLTYRQDTDGLMNFLIGSKYNQFQLFYSYDVSFSDFQQYNGGSHELSFAFTFGKRLNAKPQRIEK